MQGSTFHAGLKVTSGTRQAASVTVDEAKGTIAAVAPALAPRALDADGSGDLTIAHAVHLLQHLIAGGPAPPAPCSQRGPDPEPATSLGCRKGRSGSRPAQRHRHPAGEQGTETGDCPFPVPGSRFTSSYRPRPARAAGEARGDKPIDRA